MTKKLTSKFIPAPKKAKSAKKNKKAVKAAKNPFKQAAGY